VEPLRVVDLANIFREDAAYESLSQDQALKNAPRRENGYSRAKDRVIMLPELKPGCCQNQPRST